MHSIILFLIGLGLSVSISASAEEVLTVDGVFMSLATKSYCDTNMPGFKEKSDAWFAKWRKKNQQLVEQVENDPNYKNALNTKKPQDLVAVERMCNGVLEFIEAPKLQFSSPEKTWDTFQSALKAANRDVAVSCLTGIAKDKFEHVIQEMTDEQITSMGNAVKASQVISNSEDLAEIHAVRNNNLGGLIMLEKVGENWKISEM